MTFEQPQTLLVAMLRRVMYKGLVSVSFDVKVGTYTAKVLEALWVPVDRGVVRRRFAQLVCTVEVDTAALEIPQTRFVSTLCGVMRHKTVACIVMSWGVQR